MKKSFMVATILVIVVSMFIGCVLPTSSPGGTGGSGETSGHISGSATGELAQDIRKMLVVPEDVKKVLDAAMDLFVGDDYWVNVFNLDLWDKKEHL